mmetsp:Transcript_20790/g.59318  ORF Transcript_20790/g.59318 Transcript_20790/m.59318 type:complete len:220 (-) Transcript_20790:423-1082(-)
MSLSVMAAVGEAQRACSTGQSGASNRPKDLPMSRLASLHRPLHAPPPSPSEGECRPATCCPLRHHHHQQQQQHRQQWLRRPPSRQPRRHQSRKLLQPGRRAAEARARARRRRTPSATASTSHRPPSHNAPTLSHESLSCRPFGPSSGSTSGRQRATPVRSLCSTTARRTPTGSCTWATHSTRSSRTSSTGISLFEGVRFAMCPGGTAMDCPSSWRCSRA